MKSFISEATGHSNIGGAFVGIATTIAHKFDVPVEWLLAAMSWETGQYDAYDPIKLFVPGVDPRPKHNWIDPSEFHGAFPTDLLHWARNIGDWGFGLVGFTQAPPYTANPRNWKPGDNLPLADFQAKLRMTPMEQLSTQVEAYFRNNISRFKVPTPFATIEDFYCVVYAPGISGKPDSHTWQYLGTTYNKGKQMGIYRNFLSGYDYPKKANDTPDIGILGKWDIEIGPWKGVFVFESTGGAPAPYTQGGSVYWMDTTSTTKHPGSWWVQADGAYWKFNDDPPGFTRFFHVNVPLQSSMNGSVQLNASVQPSGFFKMLRRFY